MKAVARRLFRRFAREAIEHEVEEELRFHLESLTQEHLQQAMSLEDAKDAALKRFGNVERIKDQCVEVSRRRHPLMRAMKSFLILIFLVGVLVRVFGIERTVLQVGDILIAIGALGRLLLYVRGWNPQSFLSKPDTSSPLMLNGNARTSFTAYDQRKLTPVERVLSDK